MSVIDLWVNWRLGKDRDHFEKLKGIFKQIQIWKSIVVLKMEGHP